MTIRAFKLQDLEDICEDYGQVAVYNRTLPEHPISSIWMIITVFLAASRCWSVAIPPQCSKIRDMRHTSQQAETARFITGPLIAPRHRSRRMMRQVIIVVAPAVSCGSGQARSLTGCPGYVKEYDMSATMRDRYHNGGFLRPGNPCPKNKLEN